MLPLANALHRWACSLSQERKALPAFNHRLADATPLSCARNDCLRRMFRSFAKLHLLTAAGCWTLALIHTYWILGHR
eukprot:2425771-Pleurochrysis_carterae.AAC.1